MSAARARPVNAVRELRIPVPGEEIVLRARAAGDAPRSVLLLHSMCEDMDVWWDRGWVAELIRHRRVIAFDARGHGASSKPTDPMKYGAHARVLDVLAVLDVLDGRPVDVVGYAMGAWTAMQLAARVPGRVRSLAIGGVPASGQSLALLRRAVAAGLPAMLGEIERETGPLPESMRRRFLANDPEAMAAACAEDRFNLIEDLSAAYDGPATFYVGELDRWRSAVQSSAVQLGWSCQVIPGRDHYELLTSGAGLAAVLDFITS